MFLNKALRVSMHSGFILKTQFLCFTTIPACAFPFPSSSSPEKRPCWVVTHFILFHLRASSNFRSFKPKGTWAHLWRCLTWRKRKLMDRELKTNKLQIKCSFITTFSPLFQQACPQRDWNVPVTGLPTPGTSNSILREKKSSFPPSVKNPDKSAVLVFSCPHNKTHKPSSLKEHKFIIFKFCGPEAQYRSHQHQSRAVLLSGESGGKAVCFLPSLQGPLHALVMAPFLHLQSQWWESQVLSYSGFLIPLLLTSKHMCTFSLSPSLSLSVSLWQ